MSSYSSADKAYDLDEPPELELDLGKLIDRASDIMKTKCTSAEKLTRGTSHEVFTLRFEEGPSASPYLARAVSEIATARYLKRFTRIPVPEIYYYDLHGQDDVGAPFVIMEKMPGCHLNKIWDDLPLEGKKSVLSEIALVVAQLASLKFDQIGSLDEHGVGPLINPCLDHPMGPFQSVAEYLRSFISADSAESLLGKELLAQVENELDQFLSVSGQAAYLQPPYCLIHADFDGQNMLFVESPDGLGLKLAGLIDFEYAYTGPLYFLYEYPISIQDVSWSEEFYAENAILRAHFVRAIYDALPDSEARSTFIAALNGKNFVLSGFKNSFMTIKYSEKTLVSFSRYYIENLKDGTELAYSGRLNYISELYNEDGKPMPSEKLTSGGFSAHGTPTDRHLRGLGRRQRPGEVDGSDYYFVSRDKFRSLVAQGAFIEFAEFNGNLYGTSKQTVIDLTARGLVVLLDIEMEGVKQLKAEQSKADTQMNPRFVFVKPPSFEALEARLRGRGTEVEGSI
ncbi:hypothetical protein VTI28DRAFT_6117 [Corynascus sepedonium]